MCEVEAIGLRGEEGREHGLGKQALFGENGRNCTRQSGIERIF